MFEWLRILGGILFIDVILSGDNALVIGAAASELPANLRWIAFLFGGGGAIILRIMLTYSVTLVLHIPLVQTIGGILLLIVTIRLLLAHNIPAGTGDTRGLSRIFERWIWNRLLVTPGRRLLIACLTILIADVATSLDNVIAVAALAKDNLLLLIIGLLLSITLLLFGSAILSTLIERFPWMMLVAAIILTVAAARIVLQDTQLLLYIPITLVWWNITVYVVAFTSTITASIFWYRSHTGRLSRHQP